MNKRYSKLTERVWLRLSKENKEALEKEYQEYINNWMCKNSKELLFEADQISLIRDELVEKEKELNNFISEKIIKNTDLESSIEGSYKKHVDVNYVNSKDELDLELLRGDLKYSDLFDDSMKVNYLLDNNCYIVSREIEKI